MTVTNVLHRDVYLYNEVDRLTGLRAGTARRWINGYSRNGRDYAPILREQRRDTEWVTWGEFVETRILAEYRDQKAVKTTRLRAAVDALRQEFQIDYPLARYRPYIDIRPQHIELDLKLSSEEGRLIIETGQMILTDGRPLIERAQLAEDESGEKFAEQISSDLTYPGIVLHPGRFGGQPTFEGRRVSVETIAGIVAYGEPVEDVAATYGLSIVQVRSASEYAAKYRLAA
ncbi:DUF433 domain-containing protein [Gordonia sp. NPDC127522]|uniref:DUF433 domain-containing protein n=1 Tax=Gordonia sp. NPDC127522 TaxID=3345390 RepID=UPI003624B139